MLQGGGTSAAFFAPGWTFEGRKGGREGFELVERRFWFGHAPYHLTHECEIDEQFLLKAVQRPIVAGNITWLVCHSP